MWHNKTTGELQSLPPWGNSWLHTDIIAQNYADWEQVSAEFIPARDIDAVQEAKIAELRRRASSILAATDYKALKYAEGLLTEQDYAPIKVTRQAVRDRFNAKEAEVNAAKTVECVEAVAWD